MLDLKTKCCSGPTYHMLPSSPVNNCIKSPDLLGNKCIISHALLLGRVKQSDELRFVLSVDLAAVRGTVLLGVGIASENDIAIYCNILFRYCNILQYIQGVKLASEFRGHLGP